MAFGGAHFGAGVGSIHLDEVDCHGNENNLNNCSHDTLVSCLSGHSKDAGVRCQGRFAYTQFIDLHIAICKLCACMCYSL